MCIIGKQNYLNNFKTQVASIRHLRRRAELGKSHYLNNTKIQAGQCKVHAYEVDVDVDLDVLN